jgi:hypothetical protein
MFTDIKKEDLVKVAAAYSDIADAAFILKETTWENCLLGAFLLDRLEYPEARWQGVTVSPEKGSYVGPLMRMATAMVKLRDKGASIKQFMATLDLNMKLAVEEHVSTLGVNKKAAAEAASRLVRNGRVIPLRA